MAASSASSPLQSVLRGFSRLLSFGFFEGVACKEVTSGSMFRTSQILSALVDWQLGMVAGMCAGGRKVSQSSLLVRLTFGRRQIA